MRISAELPKCVVFIGVETERGGFAPVGTGFITSHKYDANLHFSFVATAAHVIENLSEDAQRRLVVRVNKKDGGVGYITLNGAPRLMHADAPNDVILISLGIDPTIYDIIAISADRDELEAQRATGDGTFPGDTVAAIGLYTSHYGLIRNTPVVRTGHIAAIANEPIYTARGYAMAHLIELRTIAGLSGSPVFQTDGPVRIRNGQLERRQQNASEGTILGILVGYHCVEDPSDIIPVPRHAQTASSSGEDYYSADERNTGFGVVIPFERVCEIMEREDVRAVFDQVATSAKVTAGYREASS